LALRAPARVRSLALLCTFADGRAAAPLTPRMLALGLRTRVGTRAMRRRAFLELVMPPGRFTKGEGTALELELAELFGHDLADQPAAADAQLAALRSYDATPRLAELPRVPALVVTAQHDPIAPPRLGRALARRVAGARYVKLLRASHGAPIQSADRVNRL